MNSNCFKKYCLDLILLFSALFAILFAFYAESLEPNRIPCILCRLQRVPFYIIIIASVFRMVTSYKRAFLVISMASLVMNASVAFYKAGLEKGLFEEFFQCSYRGIDTESALSEAIVSDKKIHSDCKHPYYVKILGFDVSLSHANFSYSLFLFVFALIYSSNNTNRDDEDGDTEKDEFNQY